MVFINKGIGRSSLVKFSIALYLVSMIAYTLISFSLGTDFTFILTFLSDFDLNGSLFIVYQFTPVVVYANKFSNTVKDSQTILKSPFSAALVNGSFIQRRNYSNKPEGEDFSE